MEARTAHVTTQPDVIKRFLLLDRGQPCDEPRRAESERILRAQTFIADAMIQALADDRGGVDLEVRTIDEVSLVASATLKAQFPLLTGLRLGNANIAGMGIFGAGSWTHELGLREGFTGRVTDYQLFGKPIQATATGAHNSLGGEYHFDIQQPFLTDLQHFAWRAQQGEANTYVRFVDPGGHIHSLGLDRSYADIGGLVRIGHPGELLLLGMSVSHEAERPGAAPILITHEGVAPDTSSALRDRYVAHSATRVNALLGYRHIRFVEATGLDALQATQDIPVGIQMGTLVGRSAPALGSADRDALMAGELYAGMASQRSALRFQAIGEARRELDRRSWDGILASGRLAYHRRVAETQTLIASLEGSGGVNQRVPFRLTLGALDGGLRGLSVGRTQGGERAVARVEDRFNLGSPFGPTTNMGVSFFGEAGRLWDRDVPFGATTPLAFSAGVSVLAAVPATSGALWRVDIAVPRRPYGGLTLAVRMTHVDFTTFFWRDPRDVGAARERTVPSSVFSWP